MDSNEGKKILIIESFERYINSVNDTEKLERLKKSMERFDELDKESKNNVMKQVVSSFNDNLLKTEVKLREKKCSEEGHSFGNWEEHTYMNTAGTVSFYEFTNWTRICETCGYKETAWEKPKELKESQKAK